MVLAVELISDSGGFENYPRKTKKSEDNWLRRLLGDSDEVRDGADETSMLKSPHKIIFDRFLQEWI